MRNILIVLMLITSTNLFSQVRQEITKPENHKFGVYYLDDQSIMFNTDGLIFNGGDIPQLNEIFKTADKLSIFCRNNVDIQVSKLIDTLGGYQFIFGYTPSGKLSTIGIKHENKPCNIYIYNFNGMSFVSYLTVYRIEYYSKLEIYNFKVQQAEAKLDSIIKNKNK